MKVADVMTSGVASVHPDTSVPDAVKLMLEHRVSGLPVIDDKGELVGIVTEGDFLRRVETGTERHRPRWIEFFRTGKLAEEYVLTHGRKVSEVMTPEVVTIADDAPLAQAVDLMERLRIKRIPVVSNGKVVGIVSRADLLHALASLSGTASPTPVTDAAIRSRIRTEVAKQNWVPRTIKFIIRHGVVELRGVLFDERSRQALRVLCENIPGVTEVEDHLIWVEPMSGIAVVDPSDTVAPPHPPTAR